MSLCKQDQGPPNAWIPSATLNGLLSSTTVSLQLITLLERKMFSADKRIERERERVGEREKDWVVMKV